MEKLFMEIPEKEYWLDTRWWLAEGMHTDATLRNEMQNLDDMGIGAIEFLAMDEPGANPTLYGWGTEEWVHDTHVLVEEATQRKMGVSLTSGTHWSNANLISITPDDRAAAKELDFTEETLEAGQTRVGKLVKCEIKTQNVYSQKLIAVVAAKIVGEEKNKIVLSKDTIVLTNLVNVDCLEWNAPLDGNYKIFTFWLHGTGQTAYPSSSVSYTINYLDHYGIDAFIEYWDEFVLTKELKENLRKNGRGMMYMDSLELSTFGDGGQLWGYHFVEEFQKRRGYDITPYLPFVVKKSSFLQIVHDYHYVMNDKAFCEKMHNDLYQTMTDLYMENMLKTMQEWLHSHGMKLRAEISYGLPFEISQPGKYVDGIETESLEFASQIESYRGLSGAAHIYNKIYSSETGANMHNYMMPLDFYNQIIYTQFAAGVTRTVLHGYSSICGSESFTQWPGHEGMWPIFAERFGKSQPAYQHYKEWSVMIARYQKLLRLGKPRMDIGILRLDYNFNNMVQAEAIRCGEEEFYKNKLMRNNEGLYWKDMSLQHAGYTWDYFAPQILEEDFTVTTGEELYPDGPGYQAIVIYQEIMPLQTAKKLLLLAKLGQKIVFVNGVTEQVRPMGISVTHNKAASKTPYVMENDSELDAIITEIKELPNVRETDIQAHTIIMLMELGVNPRAAFSEKNRNILTCMRETEKEKYLFVYNMLYAETEANTVTLLIDGVAKPYRADCWTGNITEIDGTEISGKTEVTLTLNPGEATMLILDKNKKPECLEKTKVFDREIILSNWNLSVEDWNEGEKKEIVEDRGLGIVTKEVYYETSKTKLEAGEVACVSWKDIPQIGPNVSGIGYYKTNVDILEDWSVDYGAVLEIESTNGCMAAVYVNGKKAEAYNINKRKIEIGGLLKKGSNELVIEVSTTLNNRLLARGYYDTFVQRTMYLMSRASNDMEEHQKNARSTETSGSSTQRMTIPTTVKDYGVVGKVTLKIYNN